MSAYTSYRRNQQKVLLKKFKHSYLTPHFLHDVFMPVAKTTQFLQRGYTPEQRLRERILSRLIWFYPRDLLDAEPWIAAQPGQRKGAHKCVGLHEGALLLLSKIEQYVPDRNKPLLDLGCNVGRLLNGLSERGYNNLYGVELSRNAIDFQKQVFPETYKKWTVSCNFIQSYLKEQEERRFFCVFTHGATLELIHPSFALVAHVARATQRFAILYVSEWAHNYPRFYEYEFRRVNFHLIEAIRPVGEYIGNNDLNSLLIFERIE